MADKPIYSGFWHLQHDQMNQQVLFFLKSFPFFSYLDRLGGRVSIEGSKQCSQLLGEVTAVTAPALPSSSDLVDVMHSMCARLYQ